MDAWTKHYRPDENAQNSRISYYLKGAIVAWLLDTRLRIATDGDQHLASVMQRLWRDFRHTGYTLEDFERTVELCSGTEVREWLHEQIRHAAELDYSTCLQFLGLRFKTNSGKREAASDKVTNDVWIGSESANTDGRLYVRKVFRGSPSDDAGLNVDDELVALDGMRVTPDSCPSVWPCIRQVRRLSCWFHDAVEWGRFRSASDRSHPTRGNWKSIRKQRLLRFRIWRDG